MSFESTGKLRKAQNKDGFEVTEKFSRNEEHQRKAETEKLNKINGIINEIDSRTQKLFNDYSATAEEKAKFVSGEESTYDNPMKYKPKFTSKSYVDEANSIKSYIEENKDYLSGEQYLAAMQNVNAFLDTDFTESDKAWNEYYNSVQKSGGKENFAKAMEEYQKQQTALKKAGLNKNSTYAQIEGVVNDTSMDAGAGPLEQAQGRAYKDRRLSSEEKDYLSSLLKTEEKVATMTDDEILARIKRAQNADKNFTPEVFEKEANDLYMELFSGNSSDFENFTWWKSYEESVTNGVSPYDENGKATEDEKKAEKYRAYFSEKYGISDPLGDARMQIENKITSGRNAGDVAYYYTGEDGNATSMTWENLYYERKVGNAYKSVTDEKSDNYNPEAAEIYNRLRELDNEKVNLDATRDEEAVNNWISENDTLKKQFEELTGTTFDAVEYYNVRVKSKERSEKFKNTIESAMQYVNDLPDWANAVIGAATGNPVQLTTNAVKAVSGAADKDGWVYNAADVADTVAQAAFMYPSVEGAAMVLAIPGAILSGGEYIGDLVSSIGHTDATDPNTYRPINIYDDYARISNETLIGTASDNIQDKLREYGWSEGAVRLATDVYGGVASGLNSIVVVGGSCALFGPAVGQVVASVILSGSAASSATAEAVQNGSTTGEALTYGFLAGCAEYIGEKISLGYFFDNIVNGTMSYKGLRNIMKSLGKTLLGGVVEGSEEVFTDFMKRLSDYAVNADHSQLENAKQMYMRQGLSEEEAKEAAIKDWWKQVGSDFIGGFVGGLLMGGAALAGNVAVNTKNKIQDTARQADIGKAITGTDAGKNVLELAEKRGLDTSKAAKEVSEGRGIGKLVSKVRNAVRNRNMGKLAQDVVATELKAAKETAMPIVGDENLADMVAEIATGAADVGAISVLAANGVLTDENANKIFEALEAVQERTENAEVRNMINDIVETAESTEGKAYNANNIYGIKRDGGTTKYILEDGTEVDSGEFGLTSKDKTLFVNAVKNMTDAEANEMIGAYRKYANGTDEGVFATTWGLYSSLGETGAAKNSERVAGYKSRIYFTDDAEVNNVLVASAIEQGVKARARNEKKVNIKARAERVIKERGRAKGEVRGEEHLGKNKSGAKTVSRTLAKLGYDVEFLSEDSKLSGKRIGDTKINGAYDAETNTIYLRADAEYNASDARGILGHTLAHEITHSIKVWSESDYNVLTDYIRDALGADFDTLVKQKMNALGTDYDMATDEVIADGCEMLLRDSKALEKLAAENSNLFVKIASKIKEFITKLRKAQADMYGGNEELHDSALRLREALKSLEELQEVFDNALENSIRNMRNALAEAENAKARANLDVLEKAAEHEGMQFSEETAGREDSKIVFSEETGVEETRDLIAVHNTNVENLFTALKLGGIAAPSIAVVKSSMGHTGFGDVSIVFAKDTIDPKRNKANKLYGSDAWTPTQTDLKKNARFDTNKTVSAVNKIKNRIGSKNVRELFDITPKQFMSAIVEADGSIYQAFAHNIGIQAAYALENGIIENIPHKENGTVDTAALKSELERTLDTDNGWRQYKKWLNGISDTVITSYDTATAADILRNMMSQPATAKPFKLTESGELVVPAVEYSSIDMLRENKHRLSSDAEAATKVVADKLISFAKKTAKAADVSVKSIVEAINAAFEQRYDVRGIASYFAESGVNISGESAAELQSLYREAVELPTPYFEAKPMGIVGIGQIRAVVLPDNAPTKLKAALKEIGVNVVEHKAGSEKSRIEAMNSDSVRNLRFSEETEDTQNRKYQMRIADLGLSEAEKISEETNGKIEFDAKTDSASPAFSEETWRESDYVQHRNEAAKALSAALGVSKAKALKYIDDVNSIAKTIADDRLRLDYSASSFGSAFVSNAEYGGSFDYTTLCKKRRIYTGTFSEIQKRLRNTALTADEILDLRNMLIAAGYEATCGLCYVEGSRAQMGKFAKEFINLYKRDNPGAWIPDMADVNTPDGVEQMRINHPEAYESYEYFWNHYGKLKDSDKALFASQQKPKLYESRKAYRNEIKKLFKSDSSIERKNLNGGIRMQSFSDFEIVHLIDTMQVIMDMSEVGLAGQAYTKVPEFAKAFGNTGLKINLSLIAKGVDENGRLIFDDREGMPHDTAFELRDQYSENVGTILVTFTDEQAFAAMADDRIDFIIPFHRSQWKKGQYNAMGLPKGTKDYTYVQNEKLIKKTYHEYRGRQVLDKATNYMPNEYWDFSKSGRENAEAYLDMCAKNNKRPKFYKFLDYDGNGRYSLKADGSTDGYWKLLIDFKMYDNDGNGSPQRAVRPDFNMEESRKMLDEYKGGHQSYPVAYDVVDKFVDKYKSEHEGMQFSEETETSRDTLVSDMEAVAETDEEKSFVEKLKAEVEKANALQEELDEVNRKIKEASFTKGADRSVLPSLKEQKAQLVKKLNRLDSKFYGYRGYDTFKTLAERKSKDAVIAERLRGKEALRSQQQKYQEAAQSIKDTLAQREENRRRREIVRDIAKRLDAIDAKAKTDSKTKHIPSALRGVVAQFRMAVNTETQDYGRKIEAANESIEKYSNRLEKLNAALEEASAEEAAEIKERIDAVNAVIEQKQRAIENYKKYAVKANDYTDALTNFYNAYYKKSLENDYEKTYYADTEAVVSAIEALKERIVGRSLYELNSEELQDVLDVTKMVQKSISNANKLFGETRSLADSVAKVADETEKYKALEKRRDKNLRPGEEKQKNKLGRWADKNIKYNMLKPAELFLQSGSDTLYGLYKKLQRAEGDAAKLIEKYGNKYRETAKENGVTKKQFDTKHRIDLDSGMTVELTSGELMTLYATSRRKQGRQHLLGGGFRLSGGIIREVRNGKVQELKSYLCKLTEADLEKISNELEDNLKKFTETMQGYMSDEMAKDGNRVSMQLYDVALFKDQFYIPLDVDDSTRPTSIEKGKGNIKIINKGMTQSLNEKAANGVYISNFSDVFAKHAQDMSSYAAFTLPLENLERVLNSSADGVRIKAIIGENLSREIFDFLKDVNGGIKSEGVLTSRLFSFSKAARVGLNLRVIIQQPTAIVRAMSEIDPKYFFGTSTKGMSDTMKRKLLEEMHDYTSTWIVKSMGGIDLNTSKAISDQITDLGVRGNKLRETIPNIINKGSFYLAEKADQIAWMSLYAACKREARAQGFTGEYLLKRAGERFDEIVNKTQVYDSVFSRAKILRSQNWLNKLASMFMAEPLTTANMMMDAARLSSHGNSAKAARITASVALSIVITNAFAAIIDALRDDDDDETYGEKYLEAIIRNLMNDFDPATYIPFVRDVISLAQGYDIERADMSLISDFITKGTNLIKAYKNGGELADSWLKFAGSILDVTGIPFSSLYRDAKAIVNTVFRGQGRKVGDSTKTNVALGSLDAFAGEIPGYAVVYSPHSKSDKLYYAMVNGDDKYVKITKEEYAEDKFNQLLKKGLKENDFRIAEAAQAHMDGDTEKYLELISEVVKDGYDEKIVQGAILAAENKLNGEDENVDRAIDGMLATKGDIISALEKGDSKYLNDYYEAKVKKYSSGEGKKDNPKKNALSATKAMLTDYYKPIYEEADSAERKRIRSILLKVKIDGKHLYDSSSFDNWDE